MYEPRTTKSNRLEDHDTRELIEHIQFILEDGKLHQELLNARGDDAQEWLDSLQKLAGSTAVLTPFRNTILKTTTRLSANAGLCPPSLVIRNVHVDGKFPITCGGSGEIFVGRIDESDVTQIVCVKFARIYQTSDNVQALFNEYFQEAIVWKPLNHPNVLPFIGVYFGDDEIRRPGLVSPWMTQGSLDQYLKVTPRESVDQLPLVHDVATGLSYLHSKEIVHADLKGANILLTPSLTALICDFGLSCILSSSEQALEMSSSSPRAKGSIRWMAPELFSPQVIATRESDIYAFGCVCYEIVTGQIPYHEIKRDVAVMAEKMIHYRHPSRPVSVLPESPIADSMWTLMEECWNRDPSERPSASTILARVSEMEASQPTPSPSPADQVPPETRKAAGRKLLVFLQGEGKCGGALRGYDLESFLEETHPGRKIFLGIVVDRDDSMTGRESSEDGRWDYESN
ncbi:Rho guanine nucleotide exchange factor [Marasmius tenuissimus]|nr:Rho guanine nucleotide exchange factor [Marasmius tenuissimus]